MPSEYNTQSFPSAEKHAPPQPPSRRHNVDGAQVHVPARPVWWHSTNAQARQASFGSCSIKISGHIPILKPSEPMIPGRAGLFSERRGVTSRLSAAVPGRPVKTAELQLSPLAPDVSPEDVRSGLELDATVTTTLVVRPRSRRTRWWWCPAEWRWWPPGRALLCVGLSIFRRPRDNHHRRRRSHYLHLVLLSTA